MKRDAKVILRVNSWLSVVFFATAVLMVGSMVNQSGKVMPATDYSAYIYRNLNIIGNLIL